MSLSDAVIFFYLAYQGSIFGVNYRNTVRENT